MLVLDVDDVILRAARAVLQDFSETQELQKILSGFINGTDAVVTVMESVMDLVIEEVYLANLKIPYSHAVIVESIEQGLIIQHYPRILPPEVEEEITLDESDAFVPERMRR